MKSRYIPELKRLLAGRNLEIWLNQSGLPREEEERLKSKWKEEAILVKIKQDMKPKEAPKACVPCGKKNGKRDTDTQTKTTLQSVSKTQSSSWRLSSLDSNSEGNGSTLPTIPDSSTDTLPGVVGE